MLERCFNDSPKLFQDLIAFLKKSDYRVQPADIRALKYCTSGAVSCGKAVDMALDVCLPERLMRDLVQTGKGCQNLN